MMKTHKNGEGPLNGEIFVFGSNLAGVHGAGAALAAKNFYGARFGVGVGKTGRAYAIPTKDLHIRTLPLEEIAVYVDQFIGYAEMHPETEFYLTAIGTGLAGYEHKDITPLFYPPLPNVNYPEQWVEFLTQNVDF
jgi:hypothetical protein